MAAVVAETAPAAAPVKAKVAKAPPAHPKYSDMICSALKALGGKGASRQAISKYILKEFNITENHHHNVLLNSNLKRGSAPGGSIVHSKGKGAAGSFKLSDKVKTEKKKPVTKKAKTAKKTTKKVEKKTPKKASAKKEVKSPEKKTEEPAKEEKKSEGKKESKPKVAKPKTVKPKTAKKSKAAVPKKPKVVKSKKSPKKPAAKK